VSQDYFRVARPEHDVKGVRTANTPFDDSGPVIGVTDTLKLGTDESDPKQLAAPARDGIARRLPRQLPSFEIRQTPYPNDPLLLDEPPPVPYVPHTQSAENLRSN
jgi:hypothetical protein